MSGDTSVESALGDAPGSIEITEKEYLFYDERADQLTAITKANYRGAMERIFTGRATANAKTVKGFAKKYEKIEEAISFYNARCV